MVAIMAELIKVANTGDIAEGQGLVVEVAGRAIAVFNVGGDFRAVDNVCGHRGGPLGEGYCDVVGRTVQCPWHGWRYSLDTGVSPVNPAVRVETFPVMVDDDAIKVLLG